MANIKTYIHLTTSHKYRLPKVFQDDDVRHPESLVEHFLEQFTQKGDVVFDPYAGYGTPLFAAEHMGRVPFGVENDLDRVNIVRSRMSNSENIINGDSRFLANIELPEIDFSITSPPYMTKENHPENPFTGCKTIGEGYEA